MEGTGGKGDPKTETNIGLCRIHTKHGTGWGRSVYLLTKKEKNAKGKNDEMRTKRKKKKKRARGGRLWRRTMFADGERKQHRRWVPDCGVVHNRVSDGVKGPKNLDVRHKIQ